MRPLLLTNLILCTTVAVIALTTEPTLAFIRDISITSLLLQLIVIPVAAAWLGAELARLLRRPRFIDPRVRSFWSCAAYGAIIWTLAAIVSLFGLAWLENTLPDWAIIAVSFALVSAVLVGSRARAKPGQCLVCGYDLSGNTVAIGLKCPECGRDAH
jgi:hypothetical protein